MLLRPLLWLSALLSLISLPGCGQAEKVSKLSHTLQLEYVYAVYEMWWDVYGHLGMDCPPEHYIFFPAEQPKRRNAIPQKLSHPEFINKLARATEASTKGLCNIEGPRTGRPVIDVARELDAAGFGPNLDAKIINHEYVATTGFELGKKNDKQKEYFIILDLIYKYLDKMLKMDLSEFSGDSTRTTVEQRHARRDELKVRALYCANGIVTVRSRELQDRIIEGAMSDYIKKDKGKDKVQGGLELKRDQIVQKKEETFDQYSDKEYHEVDTAATVRNLSAEKKKQAKDFFANFTWHTIKLNKKKTNTDVAGDRVPGWTDVDVNGRVGETARSHVISSNTWHNFARRLDCKKPPEKENPTP